MLLDQDVEFGGQVTSRTDAVDLAGEQGRDLRQGDTEPRRGLDLAHVPSLGRSFTSFLARSVTSVSSPCGQMWIRTSSHCWMAIRLERRGQKQNCTTRTRSLRPVPSHGG